MSDEPHERLAFAVGHTLALLDDREVDFEDWPDAILAALGLDDLDAAVERGASALALHVGYNPNQFEPERWARMKAGYEKQARVVLEAALTPPQ